MNILDNNFYTLRNEYIIPISSYFGDYSKSEIYNLKTVLSSYFNNISNPKANTFELEIEESLFNKSLLNDIEFFYSRAIVQCSDVLHSKLQSEAWRFVTQYYFSFFSLVSLLRIMRQGFVFFSKKETEAFNLVSTSILKTKLTLVREITHLNIFERRRTVI